MTSGAPTLGARPSLSATDRWATTWPRIRAALLAPWNWPLRTKLAIALLVPSLLAVVLGSLRIADQRAQAQELDRVARFVTVHNDVADLIKQLQLERLRAALYVANGRGGNTDAMRDVASRIDVTRQRVRAAVEDLYPDDAALVAANVQAQQALDRLPAQRVLAETSNAPAFAVVSRYSDLIQQLVALDDVILRDVNPTQVSGLANALAGLEAARDEASLQQALLVVAAQSPQLPPAVVTELQNAEARMGTALSSFRVALDPAQRVSYAALIAGTTNTTRTQLVQAVTSPTGGQAQAAQLQPVSDSFIGELDNAQAGVSGELVTTSADRRQAASNSALLNVLILVVALLVGATVVILIARQMVKLLRTLRESALRVASTQLPQTVARMRQGSIPAVEVEPVPIATREDIGQVARAFDAVHSQAVRLAAEQATLQSNVNAMYVNLSRRSQTLVDRQLRLIESLEKDEQDPDQLDSLFQLDHLATRMRRNCENLLVLAGANFTGGNSGVRLFEVVQAAVSETDQYQRINVLSLPEIAFVGRVSKDLWHLLAELLDNATNFSPPSSPVSISGTRGADGALVLQIVDRGIGMPAEELAAVNRKLSHTTDATAETARRMGLFVVGQLARRHGIGVFLQTNDSQSETGNREQGGVTVLVVIPPALMFRERAATASTGGQPVVPAPRSEPVPTTFEVQDSGRWTAPPDPVPVPVAGAAPFAVMPHEARSYDEVDDRNPVGVAPSAVERRAPRTRVPIPGTESVWLGSVRIPPYASEIAVDGPPRGVPRAPADATSRDGGRESPPR